jgi:hypothetical protein
MIARRPCRVSAAVSSYLKPGEWGRKLSPASLHALAILRSDIPPSILPRSLTGTTSTGRSFQLLLPTLFLRVVHGQAKAYRRALISVFNQINRCGKEKEHTSQSSEVFVTGYCERSIGEARRRQGDGE